MALADRHYMRDEYHSPRATTILIVVLIGAFVLQSLLLFYGGVNAIGQLGLTVAGVGAGKVWQLITFQFLHSAPWPWHVLFNCLGLYFFGRPVEQTLGSKRFLWLYLLSGIAGGLLQLLTTMVLPNHQDIPVVGASAGVCGMIAIFCSLHPMQELTAWVYFFPITVRARYFLIFLGALSLFGTLVPFDFVAHAAHLGGILLGVGYVRWGEQIYGKIFNWRPLQARQRKKALVRAASLRGRPWRTSGAPGESETAPEEFISKEVDPILDKISAHGIQSLTEQERKILDAAQKKMSKS